MKFLLDTPETIWGCLENSDFLGGASRYVQATEVYKRLTSGSGKASISRRFPLLARQWPTIRDFRDQIADAALSWLSSSFAAEAPVLELAKVLIALAHLKSLDGAALLKSFLNARRMCILRMFSKDVDTTNLASKELTNAALLICTTIGQCGELFLSLPGVLAEPRVRRVLVEQSVDETLADALFDHDNKLPAELHTWQAHMEALKEGVGSLSSAGVALECAEWLEQLGSFIKRGGEEPSILLLNSCNSGRDLLKVELTVKGAIEEDWAYYSLPAEPALTWSDICHWVVGKPCSLWPLIFETALLHRAKQLIDDDINTAVKNSENLIDSALEAAASSLPSPPGTLIHATGASTLLAPMTPGKVPGRSNSASARLSWLVDAEQVLVAWDSKLKDALVASMEACGMQVPHHKDSSMASRQSIKNVERAKILQPYVQSKCIEAAEGVADMLGLRAGNLPCGVNDDDIASPSFAPIATCALVLGRVALDIAEQSAILPIALAPPDTWRSALEGKGTKGVPHKGSTRQHESLQKMFHSLATSAHRVWISWAAQGLAKKAISELIHDACLFSDSPMRGWEEVLLIEDDVKFFIPSTPSPAIHALVLGACVEAERGGGHLLGDAPLKQFQVEIAGAFRLGIATALVDGNDLSSIKEVGALQLLFDVRFVHECLAGGLVNEAGRKKEFSILEAELSARLDPIDWATYESHVDSFRHTFLQRCGVLLGMMLRTGPPQKPGRPPAASMPLESNVLRTAPPGQRFLYLPVNTPSALRLTEQKSLLQNRSSLGGLSQSGTSALITSVGSSMDPATAYDFASFEVGRASIGADEVEPSTDTRLTGANMGAVALEAFRTSKLGTLIGGKAAEMTMSLGEGFGGAFTSLSSFTK